jgi:tetratricopeptide (TPR) repeat protein
VLARALADLEREGHAARLALAPLARAETEALVHALTRGEPAPALAARVWAATAGNPFMVVETLRAVRDGTIGTDAVGVVVLPRVRDIVAGRVDRLGERARAVAAVAAAIGREFDFGLLESASGLGAGEVALGVEELVARRLLHVVGEHLDFTHDTIRQVVYEALLPHRRRILHARVAEAIERLEGPEACDLLAHHFARAGDAARAITWLRRLAERAAGAFASEQALAVLQEALGHVDRLPAAERDVVRLDILMRQAFSLSVLGRFREILDLLGPHRERLDGLRDPALAARYFLRLGLTQSHLGDRLEALRSAERALHEALRSGDETVAGQAGYLAALECYWSGRPREGVEHARQAVARLADALEPHWLGLSHYALALNHFTLGDFDPALAATRRVTEVGEAAHDPRLCSFGAYTAGMILATRGDWDEGVAACRAALARSQDPVNTLLATGRLAAALLERGDVAEARKRLEEVLEQLGPSRLPQLRGHFATLLGEAHLALGDLDGAEAAARAGLETTTAAGYPFGVAWARRTLGRIARALGDRAGSATLLGESLAAFESIGARFEAARTRLAIAEAIDVGAARAHLAAARAAFGALGAPRWDERARALETALAV